MPCMSTRICTGAGAMFDEELVEGVIISWEKLYARKQG